MMRSKEPQSWSRDSWKGISYAPSNQSECRAYLPRLFLSALGTDQLRGCPGFRNGAGSGAARSRLVVASAAGDVGGADFRSIAKAARETAGTFADKSDFG